MADCARDSGDPDDYYKSFRAYHPLNRLASPDEIAQFVLVPCFAGGGLHDGLGSGDRRRQHGGESVMRRVLITGSSRGIGLAIAKRFARVGDEALVHGVTHAAAIGALAKIEGKAQAFGADLTNADQISKLIADVGAVDVLVNCAGIYEDMPMATASEADWDRTIAVNTTAPWRLSRGLLPVLRQRRA